MHEDNHQLTLLQHRSSNYSLVYTDFFSLPATWNAVSYSGQYSNQHKHVSHNFTYSSIKYIFFPNTFHPYEQHYYCVHLIYLNIAIQFDLPMRMVIIKLNNMLGRAWKKMTSLVLHPGPIISAIDKRLTTVSCCSGVLCTRVADAVQWVSSAGRQGSLGVSWVSECTMLVSQTHPICLGHHARLSVWSHLPGAPCTSLSLIPSEGPKCQSLVHFS